MTKYRMPAEWEEHKGTVIAWPVKANMAYPEDYEQVSGNYYASLVKDINDFEPVTVLANPSDQGLLEKWQAKFNPSARYPLEIIYLEHDSAWLRHTGPTLLTQRDYQDLNSSEINLASAESESIDQISGEELKEIANQDDRPLEPEKLIGIDWDLKVLGQGALAWENDQALAGKVLDHYKIKEEEAGLVLGGGAIISDGQGTIMVTEESLLGPERNPNLTKDDLEDKLKEQLRADKIIWLPRGLDGDDKQDVVNLARFIGPGRLMIQIPEDKEDPNYEIGQEALALLEAETDARGRELEIIRIPSPPLRKHEGKRLNLSYLNFYFVNGGLILPIFAGPALDTDGTVMRIFFQTFPNHKLRAIKGSIIAKEGGNVHSTAWPIF